MPVNTQMSYDIHCPDCGEFRDAKNAAKGCPRCGNKQAFSMYHRYDIDKRFNTERQWGKEGWSPK